VKEKHDSSSIVIAVEVNDRDLADRLTSLLADLLGARLATPGEKADVKLVLAERAAPRDIGVGLTTRELEVLELLAEGASNKTIARRLGISVHTVKFHVHSLIDKFDATGRTDTVAHAARLHVIRL
jgi:DNA-binding CsgD family transcriptional regulator